STPLTSQPMCLLSGTNSSVAGAAASFASAMLMVRLLFTSLSLSLSRGLLAQQARRLERRLEQCDIGANGLPEFFRRAAHRVDTEVSQRLHHRGIAAYSGERTREVID